MAISRYDYIIIGAGSAGCIIASELTRANKQVLLLERGPQQRHYPETFSANNWGKVFVTSAMHEMVTSPIHAMKNSRTMLTVGNIMGGSSSVNSMMYGRGQIKDYDTWSKSPLWSITKIQAAFAAVEAKLKISVPKKTEFAAAFLRACEETGLKILDDLDAPDYEGAGYNLTSTWQGQRSSSYTSFIKDLAQNDNLDIIYGAQTGKILFQEKTATAIEYMRNNKKLRAELNPGGEMIICAGALESPKLLMLSGIGPQKILEKFAISPIAVNESVGQHLLDQPDCAVVYRAKQALPNAVKHIQACAFARSSTALTEPNLQILCFPGHYLLEMTYMGLRGFPPFLISSSITRKITRALLNTLKFPLVKKNLSQTYFIMPCLMRPHSQGSLTLKSKNPSATPIVNINYYSDPRDLTALSNGICIAQKIGAATGLSQWCKSEIMPAKSDLKKYLLRNTGTTYHYAGTCQLGTVVDDELRVKDINGIRVADASIMPSLPVCTPNGACMMIGYNAAQIILNKGDALNI